VWVEGEHAVKTRLQGRVKITAWQSSFSHTRECTNYTDLLLQASKKVRKKAYSIDMQNRYTKLKAKPRNDFEALKREQNILKAT
jgi:hypothetical protein